MRSRLLPIGLLLIAILSGAAVAHAAPGAQSISVLSADADATLHAGDPEALRGSEETLLVGYDLPATGNALSEGAVRALMRFDLSTLPPEAIIESATLMLRLNASWDAPEAEARCTFQTVLDTWEESAVTWDTAPDAGDRIGWISVPHAGWDWYSLDITELAQAWHEGSQPNHGLLLRGDESRPNWRGFSSREGDYPAQLVLTWNPPTPTPTATLDPTLQPTMPPPTLEPTLPSPTPEPTLPPLSPCYLPLIVS